MKNALTSARQWLQDVQRSTNLDVYQRTRNVLRETKQYAFREVNIRNYLATSGLKKLQVGTGSNILEGWLNVDLFPHNRNVAYLDATKRFPFDDDTFDAIFSEHMIEHITYEQGRSMLTECFRILKPGGELRLVTPDLKALLALYDEPRSEVQEHYLRWMTDQFLPGLNQYEPVFVVNLAMRFSGHQFLYDGPTLEKLMQDVGFTQIEQTAVGHSARPAFAGIDSHAMFIQDEAVNEYESMAYEATKPS